MGQMRMAGLALAGGRSSRFGDEKAAALLGGRPLLQIALDRLALDCAPLAVSAMPGSQAEVIARSTGAAVVFDPPGPRGPLAGLCAGLEWARAQGCGLLATLPCDVPLVPDHLFRRLRDAITPQSGAVVVRTTDGLQSLCLVVRVDLRDPLADVLARGEHPPVHEWLADVHAQELALPDDTAFRNVNRPEDLAEMAQTWAARP